MNFCGSCGAQVPSGAGFCGACGTVVGAPTTGVTSGLKSSIHHRPEESPAHSEDGAHGGVIESTPSLKSSFSSITPLAPPPPSIAPEVPRSAHCGTCGAPVEGAFCGKCGSDTPHSTGAPAPVLRGSGELKSSLGGSPPSTASSVKERVRRSGSSTVAALGRSEKGTGSGRGFAGRKVGGRGDARFTPRAAEPLTLKVSVGGVETTVSVPLTGGTLGSTSAATIQLPAKFLTPQHASIRWNGVGWVLEPTMYGGVLSGGHPVEQVLLTNAMTVQLADRLGNVANVTALIGGGPGIVTELRGNLPQPSMAIAIGSDASCAIRLNHPMIRAEHATLRRDAMGGLLIEDRASVANTYVNGTRIKHRQQLRLGDVIQIGPYSARVGAAALEPLPQVPGVAIDVYNAQVAVPVRSGGQKVLLHGVNLVIQPATMTVVAGPSGAGKTTLMRLLAGQTIPVDGLMTYDGDDLRQVRSRYETTMGFVPQDDIVHTELTVREALSFQARLRLGEDHPAQERAEEVVKAITFVGLEAQADQIISTLSGGQRKRVSVATELLNDPKLIFLDEPTSGLDPGLDKRMMLLLRLLADQGRTVILTTHAIAHVDVADQLLLVGPGGWVIYAGPPQEACAWFGVETLADVFALIEDPDAAQAAAQRIPRPTPAEPVHATRPAMPVRPMSRSAGRGQLALFTRRQLLIMRRDLTALLVLLSSGAAVAVIVWLLLGGSTGSSVPVWWQQKGASEISIIFGCASVWFGALASVRELVKERPIWRRESLVGANPASYLGSKLLILFMIGTIQSASITVIVSVAFSPTPTQNMPFAIGFLVTLLLGFMAGAAMGLIISAVAPSSDRAQSMVPNLLILQFIFSGAVLKLGKPVVWSIGNLIPTRWVVGAIDKLGNQADCRSSMNGCPKDPLTGDPTFAQILDVLVAPPIAWLALGLLIVGSSAVVLNLLRRQARSWSIG